MHQTPVSGNRGSNSDALLAAYQLLIETTVESGGDDAMLQRALVVLASIRWPAPHRLFTALLPDTEAASLRLAASVGGVDPARPPCADISAAACLCGRALVRPGRLLCFEAGTEGQCPPCDPRGTGIHLILPLSTRGRVLGVLHAVVESDSLPGKQEQSFMVQVATLLGAELHRRRSEREHDQLEMQFLQAQKMEAVGRLAGGVAHDFNNILTAITNYADLGLLKLPPQHPLRRNFEEIIAASDRAALLTQQLLAFSRRKVLSPRVIDVNAVIAELGKTLRRMLGADTELSIVTEPGLAPIMADPALIEQVILNLTVSARDAMPQGGTIQVATVNVAIDSAYTRSYHAVAPGAYACLSISAHGPGMTLNYLDAFEGPDISALEPLTVGALGPVAISNIVRQCGGHARFETAPDSGTLVRIFFPAVNADVAGSFSPDSTFELRRGTETVLLAEDDDSVRVVMGEILRDLGYQVLEARESREALEIAAGYAGLIDLLVTDVVMPGFGGSELQRRLLATRPGLRVLYVSGVMEDVFARQGPAGLDAVFLQKPFSPWSLASRVRQVLDAASPASPASPATP